MGLLNNAGKVRQELIQGNLKVTANLQVDGEINNGLINQVNSATAAIGQLETAGFQGDLYVRGHLYQSLGEAWSGLIANNFGAHNVMAVCYGNGYYIAGGGFGEIEVSSTLGASWGANVGNPFATAGVPIYGI